MVDLYAEAYRETIETEDIQYMNDTIALITDVLDTYTKEKLSNGPNKLDVIGDRFETMRNWSAWADEQTPTATESA